jgi:energy-coupling factor transporter ATP-binding protein EcfA2
MSIPPNPFVITKAEQFNHSYAQLASLMHLKPGVADVLLSNSNVFIDGSRGSGKSMYLRLLSLPVKSSYEELARNGRVESLPSHIGYLGSICETFANHLRPARVRGTLGLR